jgi:hypothetical protein
MAKCVWALEREDVTEHLCTIPVEDARGWLHTIITTLKHEDLTRVLVTLWAIWYAKRQDVYENSFQSPLYMHCFVKSF